MTKAIALPALPAAWTVAWPELPIPQSVQIIAVDAEGKPTWSGRTGGRLVAVLLFGSLRWADQGVSVTCQCSASVI